MVVLIMPLISLIAFPANVTRRVILILHGLPFIAFNSSFSGGKHA